MEARSVVFTWPLLLGHRRQDDAALAAAFPSTRRELPALASRLPCRSSAMRTQLALSRSGFLKRLRSAAGAGLLVIAAGACRSRAAAPEACLTSRSAIRHSPRRSPAIPGPPSWEAIGSSPPERRGDLPGEAGHHQGRDEDHQLRPVRLRGRQPAEDIARALAERCRAGRPVNVLLDAVGALAMPAEYRQRMIEAGCRVESFRPLSPFASTSVNYRNHRRILVVDGRVGITGGSGTSGKWGGNGRQEDHWRDTDIRVEGPVVEQLQGAFVENWLEATGVALGGETISRGCPERGCGRRPGRPQLARGRQRRDVHDVPARHGVGAAVDLHHQSRTSCPTTR